MSSVPFFLGFLLLTCFYAGLRGGPPEKLSALLYILAAAGSASAGLFKMPGGFTAVPLPVVISDVLLAIALTVLSVRANRLWLIPATACQVLAVLVHVAKVLAPGMVPVSYAALTIIWSWPMVALLLLGTAAHSRRCMRLTPVVSWKAS